MDGKSGTLESSPKNKSEKVEDKKHVGPVEKPFNCLFEQ